MNTEQPFDDKKARFVQIIADGGTLRGSAAELGTTTTTLKRWLREDEELRAHYACAREDQADSFADEIIETSRDASLDPNDRRVRIDALKWAAGKRKPKVYGDKVVLGGDPDAPVSVKIEAVHRVIIDPKHSNG
jgi:hypothetical protein